MSNFSFSIFRNISLINDARVKDEGIIFGSSQESIVVIVLFFPMIMRNVDRRTPIGAFRIVFSKRYRVTTNRLNNSHYIRASHKS